MVGLMRSTLCALLFRLATFLVFACRVSITASGAASHDTLTAADPQMCFRPEPCGSARKKSPALGLAFRLTCINQPRQGFKPHLCITLATQPPVFLFLPLCMHFGALPARDTAARAVSGVSGAVLMRGSDSISQVLRVESNLVLVCSVP